MTWIICNGIRWYLFATSHCKNFCDGSGTTAKLQVNKISIFNNSKQAPKMIKFWEANIENIISFDVSDGMKAVTPFKEVFHATVHTNRIKVDHSTNSITVQTQLGAWPGSGTQPWCEAFSNL